MEGIKERIMESGGAIYLGSDSDFVKWGDGMSTLVKRIKNGELGDITEAKSDTIEHFKVAQSKILAATFESEEVKESRLKRVLDLINQLSDEN